MSKIECKDWIIRLGIREESNEGWIWMARPSRSVVRITRIKPRRTIYCQVRDLQDRVLLEDYHDDPKDRRTPIWHPIDTIVINQWYRDALGIGKVRDQGRDHPYRLRVKVLGRWGWGTLRAACHHPDAMVRLGTRLGVVGAWLGLVALLVAAVEPLKNLLECISPDSGAVAGSLWWTTLAAAFVTAVFAYIACRGLRPSKTQQLEVKEKTKIERKQDRRIAVLGWGSLLLEGATDDASHGTWRRERLSFWSSDFPC